MLIESAFHNAVVMLHEKHSHVINQVLDSATADAAEEVPKILPIFIKLAIDIDFRAAQITKHVAHVAERQDSKFNGIFDIENRIANVVSGFHQIN